MRTALPGLVACTPLAMVWNGFPALPSPLVSLPLGDTWISFAGVRPSAKVVMALQAPVPPPLPPAPPDPVAPVPDEPPDDEPPVPDEPPLDDEPDEPPVPAAPPLAGEPLPSESSPPQPASEKRITGIKQSEVDVVRPTGRSVHRGAPLVIAAAYR